MKWISFAALLAIVLVGCARTVERSPGLIDPAGANSAAINRWQQHLDTMTPLVHWDLSAKVGLKAGRRGDSARLTWLRDGQDHKIDIFGPFGGGRVRLDLTPNGARITEAKNPSRSAPSAAQLLQEVVGWRVPLEELMFWVKGIPAPGVVDDYQLLPEGVLANITQAGWHVSFSDYRLWDNLLLPRRLKIVSLPGALTLVDDRGNKADSLEVKVVAKSWSVDP